MALQVFFGGPSAVQFPQFSFGTGGGSTAQLLLGMYFDTRANTLLGEFKLNGTDAQFGGGRIQLHRMWRDGNTISLGAGFPQSGFQYGNADKARVAPTDDGRVARFIQDRATGGTRTPVFVEVVEDEVLGYYAVSPLWPGDLDIPGRLVSADMLEPSQLGLIRPVTSDAFVVVESDSAGAGPGANTTRVYHVDDQGIAAASIVVSVGHTGIGLDHTSAWIKPRQIIAIDASTVALVCRPGAGAGGPNEGSAAWVHVFDITSQPWTHAWSDTLPASDDVCGWDPINRIMYSTIKRPGQGVLHISKLERSPGSVASASIIGTATELSESTRLSTIVQDQHGSVISNVLVAWTLDDQDSQGQMLSTYSLTNNQGIASNTYIGPVNPDGTLTERVNVIVTDVSDS